MRDTGKEIESRLVEVQTLYKDAVLDAAGGFRSIYGS
jgi:hypothetical protein